jgi:NAD(P)-dependent dehydrogenase (short-subunit alcohol dehydrogenase family)
MSKIEKASPDTKLSFIECDLGSLASVKQAAGRFLHESKRLDVLMCNAGVMALAPGLSKEGYEIQFATNHLGHALLIKSLLPCMLQSAAEAGSDVRIIIVSSVAHKTTPRTGIDFETLKTDQRGVGIFYKPDKWVRYGQSKLANLLYAQELARRYPNITSVSVHPGFVRTALHDNEGFMDRVLLNLISGGNWITVVEGPYTQTWAATTENKNLENGAYYEPVGVKGKIAGHASDPKLAQKLWEWTELELASYS